MTIKCARPVDEWA